MSSATDGVDSTVIVFDLGGVMAEISHTWEDAAACAGVDCSELGSGSTRLAALPEFEQYQNGSISLAIYLSALAKFVGCKESEALAVHNGILVVEYPGIPELIAEIHKKGITTGCLSNTNEPHWECLALNGDYPSIHSLKHKMASHLVGLSKPSHEIYRTYASAFGLSPESIVFFDDYRVNVDAANECGWRARWIDSSGDTPAQMRTYLSELGVI